MSRDKKYFLLIICLIFLESLAFGQATNSPFSTFGLGETYSNALTNTQGMAGVGVSQPQFFYANTQNPALLVYNNLTVFHAGMIAERRTITADTLSEKTKGGNLNYLVLAFPVLPNRWSTAIALSPYSSVKYKLRYVDDIGGSPDQVRVIEEGSGGISQLSWANGVRVYKSIAVGLKASYLFGSTINKYQNQLITSNQPANYIAAIEDRSYVKDFLFSAGVSYTKDSLFSRQRYRLSFGAVYDFATNLKTRQRSLIYRADAIDNRYDVDTLAANIGRTSLPSGITGGISLSRGSKWTIGAEMNYSDQSTFRSVSRNDEGLSESYRVALGAETTPDGYSTDKYFNRVTYRAGVSMEQYPYLANNNKVKDIGINFGMSLPTGRSSIDLAFKYGKRGNKADNLIEENYFRVYFGFTFNDQWFIRRRFD